MPRSGTRRWMGELAWILLLVLALSGVALAQDEGFDLEEEGGFEIEDTAKGNQQAYKEVTNLESEIELGFFYNSSDDQLFGNYNGFLDDRFYALGNVDIWRRNLHDWGDDYSVRLRGQNLGLDSRWAGAEFGRQGRYGVFFEYDQLPVFRSETTESFFLGLGTPSLTLPMPWTPGNNGTQMTDLDANLRSYDVESQRKRWSGGGSLEFTEEFGLDVRYDYETKKGNKLSAAMMGLSGGNPRSVVVPQPLDYRTQQLDAMFRYVGDDAQFSLGYYGSGFDNGNNFFEWENPYLPQATWNPTAGYNCTADGSPFPGLEPAGCGMGRKATAPDNWFHQILASGGYDLPHRSRVTLSTAFGWMLQDDDFQPYSVNSALTATTQAGAPTDGTDLAALPRLSLDGEIFTTVLDFRVASKPIDKLNLDLGYRFDNRDNNTPQDLYVRIRADSEDQNPADPAVVANDQARFNLPYSYRQHKVDADAGYRIWRRTDLTLGYEWKMTERDHQEVEKLQENTIGAILTSQPTSFFGTRMSYGHSWRNGNDYVGNRPFVEGNTPLVIAGDAASCLGSGLIPADECPFENHPLLRKSYLANRERDEFKFSFSIVPREDTTLALYVNYMDEDYEDSEVGVTNVRNWGPGIDLSYTPCERLSTHTFYSYQDFRTMQNGWSFTGTGAMFTQVTDPDRRWSSTDQDRTHTVGVGFDLGILPGRLDFGADYLFARSNGQIDLTVGPALTAGAPYPDSTSTQHNASVYATYQFTENISMRIGYLFAYFKQSDWAVDGLDPDSLSCSTNACVIGSGRDSEGYTANVVSWSLTYRFW